MMNDSQLTEIRNYLLNKKLPIDILMEVQDHFISQINDLQREENLSFDDAFQKTKNSWNSELKLYWDGSYNLEDSSKFKRKVERQVWVSVLKQTSVYSLLVVLLVLLVANFTNENVFRFFIVSIMVVATVFPALIFFKNYQNFRLIKKYENYVLTLYQVPAVIFISVLGVALTYVPNAYWESELLYGLATFKKGFQDIGFAIGCLFIVFTGIMIYLSQKEFLKRIDKVKPFLQYLKAAS